MARSKHPTLGKFLDFIAEEESEGDYNRIWNGIAKKDYPQKKLKKMTVRAVLAWQDSIDWKYRSEASGRYQMLEDTLRKLAKAPGILDALFDKTMQDNLAVRLLEQAGLLKFLAGKISIRTFGNHVASIWASLPLLKDEYGKLRGQSRYKGDGLNIARVSAPAFETALVALKATKAEPLHKAHKTTAKLVPLPRAKRRAKNRLIRKVLGMKAF